MESPALGLSLLGLLAIGLLILTNAYFVANSYRNTFTHTDSVTNADFHTGPNSNRHTSADCHTNANASVSSFPNTCLPQH